MNLELVVVDQVVTKRAKRQTKTKEELLKWPWFRPNTLKVCNANLSVCKPHDFTPMKDTNQASMLASWGAILVD